MFGEMCRASRTVRKVNGLERAPLGRLARAESLARNFSKPSQLPQSVDGPRSRKKCAVSPVPLDERPWSDSEHLPQL